MNAFVSFIVIVLLFVSVIVIIRLIVNTASKYFSPVLREISTVTAMPEHFAGVTVLAFGNGAPDVFTVIAARSGSMLTGMNALLGGVVFVTTIVLGTIILSSERNLQLNARNTIRDTIFLSVGAICIALTVYLKVHVLLMAGLYFVVYFIYIAVIAGTMQSEIEEEGSSSKLTEQTVSEQDVPYFDRWIDFLFYPVEYVVETLQSASIPVYHIDPVLHDQHWRQFSAWYPITVPALVLCWVGNDNVNIWYILMCLVLSGVLAACKRLLPMPVLTTVHEVEEGSDVESTQPIAHSKPAATHSTRSYGAVDVSIDVDVVHLSYEQRISLYIWLSVSFVACIIWIDLIAAVLIACLSALGEIIKIPRAFLGLTVLAWGNSVGDLSTNTTLAAQGKGIMALSACFGGPLFNILFGVGVALLINGVTNTVTFANTTYSSYGTYSLMISVGFLLVVLCTTLCTFVYTKFVATYRLGYVLIGLYVAYSVVQVSLLVFNLNSSL